MATYYVSKAGNDAYTGLSGSGKLTIGAALTVATSDGDTVEIIDEASYNEGDLAINYNGISVVHTASHLGRPKIYGTGLGGNAVSWAFKFSNISGTTIRGLELSNYNNYIFHNSSPPQKTINLTGSFIHDVPKLQYKAWEGNGSGDPATFNECIMYLNHASQTPILFDGTACHAELRNCLITGAVLGTLLESYTTPTITASYCTFINRAPTTTADPMLVIGKITNCIVSATANNYVGVASDDHTYNLVQCRTAPFRDQADTSDTAAGPNEITGTVSVPINPLFVDGTAIGSSVSIAANYQLQETSPAVGYANPMGILFDLTGNARPEGGDPGSEDNPDMGCFEYPFAPPVPDPWNSYGTQSYPKFGGDFTINRYQNLTSNYKLTTSSSPGQVPFSLGPKGPGTLRGRLGAYGVSKGGDPSTIIQTSSA